MRLLVPTLCVAVGVCTCAAGPPPATHAATGLIVEQAALADDALQEDFPAMCLDSGGMPWVVYVACDGQADLLKIARRTSDGFQTMGTLGGPGIIHQPALACDGQGTLWAVWSELDEHLAWKLKARAIVDSVIQDEAVTLEGESGSAVFSDAATDGKGRVWVTWQSFRNAAGSILAKYFDPADGRWSEEIRVTHDPAGNWEPRLAFAADDAAWIAFDSSRGGAFNIYLARVAANGRVKTIPVSKSPRYEARPSIASTSDGKGFWLAWESGKLRWGMNSRGVGGTLGLNADKRIEVAFFDLATQTLSAAADVTPVLKAAGAPKIATSVAKKPKKNAPRQSRVQALNLPRVAVDASGQVWLACRYYRGTHWKIALTRYNPDAKTWAQAIPLESSSYSQDRHCHWATDADDRLWLAWPSDLRTSKRALISGVYLARIDASASMAESQIRTAKPKAPAKQTVRWGDDTPDRLREDRHTWSPGDDEYGLYWGDFHRHTDVSNCRTPDDGCIVEQFRYAFDIGKLDMLGTSDHTDVGKPYDPYEWWCSQKLADVFHVPGYFSSFYVYEREQRWPWGHRNVIFTERNAPIIYIKRALYRSMPWNEVLPVRNGPAEISPAELWQLLRKAGKPVTIMSHTGATGMGTNWDGYEKIDAAVENLVEIYQGARVSYEGTSTPQPQVAFPRGASLVEDAHGSAKTRRDFGAYNKGVYQNALKNGHRLGVFANSDHISTHTSFGGVYAKAFTREGLLEGMNARRTIAATDKIFMEFSCEGHLLGEEFVTSKKPILKIAIHGTARLSVVTILRNEADYQKFQPQNTKTFEMTYIDEQPIVGENRYYVRVQQLDGNMGWTSPIWMTYQEP